MAMIPARAALTVLREGNRRFVGKLGLDSESGLGVGAAGARRRELPVGVRVRVDYLDASAPLVAVRLQEVFGLAATPLLGRNRVPVTFRLLSPAQRPVQVTRDLQSFWRGSYAEVRKELRGRYPKHYWPENPLEAQPTRGTRRPR